MPRVPSSLPAALVLASCAARASVPAEPVLPHADPPAAPPRALLADVYSEPEDAAETESLRGRVVAGAQQVEAFFGRPFPEPFELLVLPDRDAFTASFPPEWGMPDTACWMVAAGVADAVRVLSPRTWSTDACEHDPDDAAHVQGIVTHELVHVFHGQMNPTRDFTGCDDIGWFLEGLATLASGQLDGEHAGADRAALAAGAGPARLEDAWSGPYRYGVSGSLVRFLELELGRAVLLEMLAATTEEELLALAGLDEDALLAAWRASVGDG